MVLRAGLFKTNLGHDRLTISEETRVHDDSCMSYEQDASIIPIYISAVYGVFQGKGINFSFDSPGCVRGHVVPMRAEIEAFASGWFEICAR